MQKATILALLGLVGAKKGSRRNEPECTDCEARFTDYLAKF